MSDQLLEQCNKTELLAIALRQGLPRLRRGISKERLISLVTGEDEPGPADLSGTTDTRQRLENFITANIDRIRNQLPGCTGRCTIYPCTDGKHATCFSPNKDIL